MATKDYSNKQERMIANYLEWDVVSGSGARSFHPGDVKSDRFLGECKTHVSEVPKVVFYKKVWDKIAAEAMSQMKVPVLFVDDGSQKITRTWCLFPANIIPSVDKFYECQCAILYPQLKCKVNIQFDPYIGNSILKNYDVPDKVNYLSLVWHKQKFALLPLDKFNHLIAEISNI